LLYTALSKFVHCLRCIYIVTPYGVNITGDNRYPHGSQLQLYCLSEGGPQLEYSWIRANTFANDTITNTNNVTISNVTTLDGGNYTCTVTNDAGSSSNTVTVYGELHYISYLYVLCTYVGNLDELKISLILFNSWSSVY